MAGHSGKENRHLYTWMLEHQFQALKRAHLMVALVASGVAFVFYTNTGLEPILYWAAFIVGCQALLGLSMLSGLPLHHWIRVYTGLHVLTCLGWGVLPVLFFAQLEAAYQHFYAMVVTAAGAVCVVTFSHVPRLFVINAALMIMPVAIMMVVPGLQQGSYATSVGVALFMTVGVALMVMHVYREHAVLRGQADSLLSLDRARESLREHQSRLQAERDRAQEAGKWDAVTGTLSQKEFLEELGRHAEVSKLPVIVVCIRVAGFKYVNMAFGRDTGDEVLREMAARIVQLVGEPSRACRTGGGEFLAFVDAPRPALRHELRQLCEKPCDTDQGPVMMNAYMGMSTLAPGESYMEGLYSALHAAEQAKSEGGKDVHTLDPANRTSQRNRSLMRFELSKALARDEFHLVYQPQHRMSDSSLTGFEALLRWESSMFGPVSPGEFIPVAEESGIIEDVGTWVIFNALAEFSRSFSEQEVSLSLNVSLPQLESGDFVEIVRQALESSGLAPRRLTLEITESTFMASPEVLNDRIAELRAIGVRISLDDFGTGYSSLSYLTRIPLNELKIDRAFVVDIAENSVSRALVGSIVQVCDALEVQAVIEGIEDPEQMEELASLGHVLIQGYIFSRPMQIADATEYSCSLKQTAG